MNTSPTKFFGAIVSGLSWLYLAYVLVRVWIEPMAWDDGKWVPFGVGLLILEFLLLHSSAFVAGMAGPDKPLKERVRNILALSVGYGLMCLGFVMATDSPSLLIILGAVTVSRIIASFSGDTQPGMPKRAAHGTAIYMLCVALSIFVTIPEMGITREVLDEVYPTRGSGLWETHPQNAIVCGALYFAVMGVLEIFVWSRSAVDTVPFKLSH